MSDLIIILFVISFLCVVCVRYLAQKKLTHMKALHTNIKLVQKLKVLLINIQQHRGLTTGYLHGDLSLDNAVRQAKMRVDNQWRTIENDHTLITEDKLFEGISTHWQRLSSRWQQSVVNNIEQHNRLIVNLLYLIENQAESYGPMLRFGRDSGLDVIWKELLETIEAIGQTRAIGMGVVSAGTSSAVERIQLKFLVEKVSSRLATLESSFNKESKVMENKHWARKFIREARDKADVLLVFIESSLLSGQTKSVSSETFFDLASAAILPLDELFVEAQQQIEKFIIAQPHSFLMRT